MKVKEHLERLETKLDSAHSEIVDIRLILAAQHATLGEHIRRTEALERVIEPVQKKIWLVMGAVAFIGLLGTVVSIFKALYP